ncbi:MAG TPA: SpoIIE family protein phosphatase [Vicinamibacteria bacterium]|nr:SpoIIE family protein phosphatase [Vicinamibacteria bacterium]
MKSLYLRVTPPTGAPFGHECTAPVLVLGRSRTADLTILDQYLSRLHAKFFAQGDDWLIEDMGSHNPTLINDRPLTGPTPVHPGDVLRLGATHVAIQPGPIQTETHGIFKSAVMMVPEQDSRDTAGGEPALRHLTDRLKLVNDVHRALAGPISLEALLEMILDRAFTHLKPEEGAIFLKTPSGELVRAASRRVPGLTGDFLYSTSLIREVSEKRMAALVDDASADERFAAAESIHISGVRSLLAAPLLDSAEGCLGMIVLNSRLHVKRFSEEDLELLVSLASAAALRVRNVTLAEEAARHLVLAKELDLAREVQMSMLPREFPKRAEFELAARLKPARAVGGDLYDFLADERKLWLLLGDVSGKGFPAALTMAVTKTLFRALVQVETSPAAVLGAMNRELARDNESGMFVTAFAACLELASGELAFSNAGHNRPYVLRNGAPVRIEEAAGTALGVIEGGSYASGRLRLQAGDVLYVYTDGVTEALEPGREQYSEARLEAWLRTVAGLSAQDIVDKSLAAVQDFSGKAPQSDDIAILAVRYLRSV